MMPMFWWSRNARRLDAAEMKLAALERRLAVLERQTYASPELRDGARVNDAWKERLAQRDRGGAGSKDNQSGVSAAIGGGAANTFRGRTSQAVTKAWSALSTLRPRRLQSPQRRLDRHRREVEEAREGLVELENEKDRGRDREGTEGERHDARRV